MIDTTLIQGALLGLQQNKDARFCANLSNKGPKAKRMGWWWKHYVADTFILEVSVYITKSSPTGYAVQVEFLDQECTYLPEEDTITILDKPLQNFDEFQALFDNKFMAVTFRDWKKKQK